jgi:hypothetical protein
MLFNTIFNNISVIPWRSVLLVEENGTGYGATILEECIVQKVDKMLDGNIEV